MTFGDVLEWLVRREGVRVGVLVTSESAIAPHAVFVGSLGALEMREQPGGASVAHFPLGGHAGATETLLGRQGFNLTVDRFVAAERLLSAEGITVDLGRGVQLEIVVTYEDARETVD